jgi:hypothetical protein
MKSCKYCKGKYEPSLHQSMGRGCSFECKRDIASKKIISSPCMVESTEGSAKSKVVKFSSFTNKPRKPLKSRSNLKTKTLSSNGQLKSNTTLNNNGMTGPAAKKVKAVKKAKAEAKLAITPAQQTKPKIDLSALHLSAKTIFHKYVRLRDQFETCICCGQSLGEDYHAGHYKESGSNAAIRFNEFNVSAQRADCNIHFGGDRGDYEKNLRVKFGSGKVDWLNKVASSKVAKSYTSKDYKAIIEYYKAMIIELNGGGEVEFNIRQNYLRVA